MKSKNNILKKGLAILEDLLNEHEIAHHKEINPRVEDRIWDAKVCLPEIGREILVESKSVFQPKQIQIFRDFDFHFDYDNENLFPLIITKRITENAFNCCVENGIGVIDLNKNVYIKLPGLHIERYRESKDETRLAISGTGFSAKASRIVRAFLAKPERSWHQSELVDETDVTQGYISQNLQKLQANGYIQVSGGIIKLLEPDRLLDDWLAHYRFDRHEKFEFAISFNSYQQGLEKLADELKKFAVEFSFTGWSAAYLKAPYGIPPKIMAYVKDFPEINNSSAFAPSLLLDLPKGQEGNVVLYRPQDNGVFHFSEKKNDLPLVSAPQLYLDLSRMPRRAKDQAEVIREKFLDFEDIIQ